MHVQDGYQGLVWLMLGDLLACKVQCASTMVFGIFMWVASSLFNFKKICYLESSHPKSLFSQKFSLAAKAPMKKGVGSRFGLDKIHPSLGGGNQNTLRNTN